MIKHKKVKKMKEKFNSFYDAWWFLTYHPMCFNPSCMFNDVPDKDKKYYGQFDRLLDITVVLGIMKKEVMIIYQVMIQI